MFTVELVHGKMYVEATKFNKNSPHNVSIHYAIAIWVADICFFENVGNIHHTDRFCNSPGPNRPLV